MSAMNRTPPDSAYLEAFLQGARFALFAIEGRIRNVDEIDEQALEEVFEEFHELFRDAYSSQVERKHLLALSKEYLGKN